ncbi:GPIX protein, partial [Amia calva]|nr:GPIX protein [Amia calva]
MLLLLSPSSAQTCPDSCSCLSLKPAGFTVNCSSRGLTEVPPLPPSTTELHLQNNLLTTVPPGRFDGLQGLRKINLSANPWHCGCDIVYLKAWLEDQDVSAHSDVRCFSPATYKHKPLLQLGEKAFSACEHSQCVLVYRDKFIMALLCLLLLLLLWSLTVVKTSPFIVDFDQRHKGMEMESLQSLKPKDKRSGQASSKRPPVGGLGYQSAESDALEWTEENETTEQKHNMELLPQILDILQKTHNIKIKTP